LQDKHENAHVAEESSYQFQPIVTLLDEGFEIALTFPNSTADDTFPSLRPASAIAIPSSAPRDLRASESTDSAGRAKLPRRDLLLLPLLSISTVLVLFAIAEVTTRAIWSSEEHGFCMMFDPIAGPHGKPNCTSIVKLPEGRTAVMHFNSCGYRSNAPCGPKPAGTVRLAILGSSIAEGYALPSNEIFASLLSNNLAAAWRRPVEYQDLGADGCPPIYTYRHIDEALRLKPDAIILPINPWDIEQDVDPRLLAVRSQRVAINRAPAPVIHLNPLQKVELWIHGSRTMLVAQHFMLQNRDQYLKMYLLAGGDHTQFVRYPFSRAWKKRFETTDLLLGEMARKIRAAGIRFVVVAVPERAQMLMLGAHDLPPGVDPTAFQRRVAEIAAKHGIEFVDAAQEFKTVDVSQLFYVVDGHPTPVAHRLLAQAIAAKLESRPASR
jgi:hypothetical protein